MIPEDETEAARLHDRILDLINDTEPQADNYHKTFDQQRLSDDSKTKILSCPYEIIIAVSANVLEENPKGELIGCVEICDKNYHIPVPIGADYHEYMNIFLDHLEKCISSSATMTHQGVTENG